jgi:Fe-S oxidoreductase
MTTPIPFLFEIQATLASGRPPIAEAGREIMWNVSHPANAVVMYLMFGVALVIGGNGVWQRVKMWRSGKDSADHTIGLTPRLASLFIHAGLQQGVARDASAGIIHSAIYLGFLVLLFTTTMVFIDHDLGIKIYQGWFYLFVTVISDLFGVVLLAGVVLAARRRKVLAVDRLHAAPTEFLPLIVLGLLVIQGYVLEGARIHATNDPWAAYSPVGWAVAQLFWSIPEAATRGIHFFTWWFHTATVMAVIGIAPYTKFFHIIASSTNLFFRPRKRPAGALKFEGDIAEIMERGDEVSFGLNSIKDYSWKQLLDLDACTSCGRCQEVCPAYGSGKSLSPKWMILDSRNHMLNLQSRGELTESRGGALGKLVEIDQSLLASFLDSANAGKSGGFRAENPLVQSAASALPLPLDARISGAVMDQSVFWSCNTCLACVEACPVGINHVDHIVENRRNMVLMHGEIPSEAQATLRKLENQGNPFGDPSGREAWYRGLGVRELKPGDEVDYLYWVGCVSAFDPRKQKIAQALVKIMQRAGLNFGVLGKFEKCSGDPARRLGDENLFQTLAKENIATLKNVRCKTIVANCPHCFNTLKNEYPQLDPTSGTSYRVMHHSQLIQELLHKDQLGELTASKDTFTFHDPCYLGRYNDEYEAPREALVKIGASLTEMSRSRNKGMCCGAGGGHFWHDMKVGERVNVQRVDQAAETGADRIATACPFCMQMMEDGVKLTDREESLAVRDIAEVVAAALI